MDIFQHFLSHQSENTSAFSDIFRTAKEFHLLHGQKSYLLNHYLSMFFRLIVEMDFCALEDEIYQSISDLQKKIRIDFSSLWQIECKKKQAFWACLCFVLLILLFWIIKLSNSFFSLLKIHILSYFHS